MMMNRKLIKFGLVGAAITAIALGLGIGLHKRNSTNDNSHSSSNAENSSNVYIKFDDNVSESGDCLDGEILTRRKVLLVSQDNEYRIVEAPHRRRRLRREMVRSLLELPVMSMSMPFSKGSKSAKSIKSKSVSSKNKVSRKVRHFSDGRVSPNSCCDDIFKFSISIFVVTL